MASGTGSGPEQKEEKQEVRNMKDLRRNALWQAAIVTSRANSRPSLVPSGAKPCLPADVSFVPQTQVPQSVLHVALTGHINLLLATVQPAFGLLCTIMHYASFRYAASPTLFDQLRAQHEDICHRTMLHPVPTR